MSATRDDYGLLSSFVQEKKLRVKNNKKVVRGVFIIDCFNCLLLQAHVSYNDEVGSDSSDDHDAYLERMKAEGEEVDSEDGKNECNIFGVFYFLLSDSNILYIV